MIPAAKYYITCTDFKKIQSSEGEDCIFLFRVAPSAHSTEAFFELQLVENLLTVESRDLGLGYEMKLCDIQRLNLIYELFQMPQTVGQFETTGLRGGKPYPISPEYHRSSILVNRIESHNRKTELGFNVSDTRSIIKYYDKNNKDRYFAVISNRVTRELRILWNDGETISENDLADFDDSYFGLSDLQAILQTLIELMECHSEDLI